MRRTRTPAEIEQARADLLFPSKTALRTRLQELYPNREWMQGARDYLVRLTGFSDLRFEATLPTGLGGTPPHLDFLAEHPDTPAVAAESKLTEFLQGHDCTFALSYNSVSWPKYVGAYTALMARLRVRPDTFTYLNAAQLVKHAFGLGTRFGDRKMFLLYLFWEPENRDNHPEFDQHREELSQFATCVGGSSVQFVWKSYPELWAEWTQSNNLWLKQHGRNLLERYSVTI